jgi:hypothetical protein
LVADFSGGTITSDAGVLLLREADRRTGLLDAVNDAIPDPRNPALITHPQRTMLAQRVFGLACGYEDLNDHQRLRDDPVWQAATDHPGPDDDPALASPPTLCRLENRVSRLPASPPTANPIAVWASPLVHATARDNGRVAPGDTPGPTRSPDTDDSTATDAIDRLTARTPHCNTATADATARIPSRIP